MIKDTDRGWKALMKKVAESDHVVTIGLQGAQGEAEHTDTGLTNAHLASVHEFGAVIDTGNGEVVIPERSFIRSTVDKNDNYKKVVRQIAEGLMKGKVPDAVTGLKLLGEKVSSDIKRSIEQGLKPENAASTIARKGSSKPLIDTAQMKNAITYDVHKATDKDKAGTIAGNK